MSEANTTVSIADVRLLEDRLLVDQDDQETISAGTWGAPIHLPETVTERRGSVRGLVLAAGPGRIDDDGKRVAMTIAKGDRVVFSRYSGLKVKIDHEDYVVLREDDVLAREVE